MELEPIKRQGERFVIGRDVIEEAERLASYWEICGDTPATVADRAVSDLLGFVRYFAELD